MIRGEHAFHTILIALHLDMTKLSDLKAWVGYWNWPTCFETMEEPLFNRVVIQWPIDIHWPDGGPINSFLVQQALCLQLSLVSALGINCIGLVNKRSHFQETPQFKNQTDRNMKVEQSKANHHVKQDLLFWFFPWFLEKLVMPYE